MSGHAVSNSPNCDDEWQQVQIIMQTSEVSGDLHQTYVSISPLLF